MCSEPVTIPLHCGVRAWSTHGDCSGTVGFPTKWESDHVGAQGCHLCPAKMPFSPSGLQLYPGHSQQLRTCPPGPADLPPSPRVTAAIVLGGHGLASPLGPRLSPSLGPWQHCGLSHWTRKPSPGGSGLRPPAPTVLLRCAPPFGATAVLWIFTAAGSSFPWACRSTAIS